MTNLDKHNKEHFQPGLWNKAKPDHLSLPVLHSLSLFLPHSTLLHSYYDNATNQQYHRLLLPAMLQFLPTEEQKSLGIYSC